MSKEERERLVAVHVRIMGSPARELYFVAKDVCLLIHTRKGNVAKSIGQFTADEKVRMSVVCPRSNGTVSTHILTALTVKGVRRLLTTSRSPLAAPVLKWIMKQVDCIEADWHDERRQRQIKKQQQQHAADSAHAAAGANGAAALSSVDRLIPSAANSPQQPALRKMSEASDVGSRSSCSSAKSSPSISPSSYSSAHPAPVVPLAPLSPGAVVPLHTADGSTVLKPAPVSYKSGAASATPQLAVSVRSAEQTALFSQADRKTGSLPSSPSLQPMTATSPLAVDAVHADRLVAAIEPRLRPAVSSCHALGLLHRALAGDVCGRRRRDRQSDQASVSHCASLSDRRCCSSSACTADRGRRLDLRYGGWEGRPDVADDTARSHPRPEHGQVNLSLSPPPLSPPPAAVTVLL